MIEASARKPSESKPSSRPRIAIGAVASRWLRSGLGVYAEELTRALATLDDSPELILYGERPATRSSAGEPANPVHVLGRWKSRLLRRNVGCLEWWLPRLDLVHFTDVQTVPTKHPPVVTVHDLGPFRLPELYPDVYLDAYNPALPMYRRAIQIAVRRAGVLLCVSETTREDLVARFPEARERAVVVRSGVRRPPSGFARAPRARPARLLVVGRVEHRKNLPLAVQAVKIARERGHEVELDIVGSANGVEADVVRAAVDQVALGATWVHWHGDVDDATLWNLLSTANALLSTSVLEGFSFPPLEAVMAGVPVVASDIPIHRETVDGLARLVQVGDVNGWARAIEDAVSAGGPVIDAQRVLTERGISWPQCAAATADVYRRVLGR